MVKNIEICQTKNKISKSCIFYPYCLCFVTIFNIFDHKIVSSRHNMIPGVFLTWNCWVWWQQSYWRQFPDITKLNGVYFPLETICHFLFTPPLLSLGSNPPPPCPLHKVFNWAAKYLSINHVKCFDQIKFQPKVL